MNQFIRKSLPYAVCAVVLAEGYLLWRRAHPPDQAPPPAAADDSVRPVPPPDPAAAERFAFYSDPSVPHQARIARLRETLAPGCGEADLACLYHLLLVRPPAPGERQGHWQVLANDLMEQLCRRDPDAGRFTGRMLRLAGDRSRDPVLRDYAVQHLAAWLDPRRPAPGGRPVPAAERLALRNRITAAFAEVAMDPSLASTSIPGTALMALANLSRVDAPACRDAFATLKPWLARILTDGSDLSMPVRVSVIHAAAAAAPAECLPALRAIAYRREAAPALRLPAIAAIARCGDASDLEPLRAIPSATPSLAFAAGDAVRVLSARSGS